MGEELKEITRRLDIIIKLIALNAVDDLKLQKDKIIRLSSFGLRPSEIAEILGTTSGTISVTLSEYKRRKK